ncbi:MAG: radical SAM family heme chaperone HemW [Rhodocyclaceae bacterium]|nr:radical SAM family heme chaperone HemW [Rhodocyclaceae bacterium]MDZ4215917.1 radical SAM family heme chaperone HemW [Rhodocyclaceae bacterium]
MPLSLYVHWPWCVRKCPYCDFNSHESVPQEATYLDALIADLEAALPLIWGRPIISIFIGGGTPSLMSGATVDALLAALRMRLPLLPEAEITLEANPGTVEAARFAAYRDAGVNRLSLGIQSFADAKLAALGRIHSGDEAQRAIEIAQKHFERVNLDLMYALPEQTLPEAQRDLATAIATGVSHLSAYHLTLEPNTPFHHAPPPLPDDDLAADMQDMVEETLATAGYQHYETSAFAKPRQQCQHNLNYWGFGDYLGIGAGAHSKLSDHTGIRREARPRHPKDYLADPVTRQWQPVTTEDLPGEFMMNALRLTDGVPLAWFSERTGLPLSAIEKSALAGRQEGLLEVVDNRLRPTPQGRRFLNRLITLFLDA